MSSHEPRLSQTNFIKLLPLAYEGLSALSKASASGGLDAGLIELVKIRVSQINGCAFCVKYHLDLARKLGVSQGKLDLVSAWRDAPLFSDQERSALALAEEATHLASEGVSDAAYDGAVEAFGAEDTVRLLVALAGINAWNRLGVGLRFSPQV